MTAHGDVNPCCPLYHEAIELIGRRWTGAILQVLLRGPHRFSEIGHAVPELSDRLLSERMKELEARGVVVRREEPELPARVNYQLSDMGRERAPALAPLEEWAHGGLRRGAEAAGAPGGVPAAATAGR